ncbi:NAD-P-binding protein [Mycena polygramma]|nr:NAD-P-binding protein [Mycena polygramma]
MNNETQFRVKHPSRILVGGRLTGLYKKEWRSSEPIMTLPAFTFSTTADEVASTFAEPEIRGTNVLVTGTSINGLGFETARVLAKHANLVIITGYNTERLRLTEKAIKKETPAANIRQLVVDLSSLAWVRRAAAEVNAYAEPIHVLIHNAAANGGPLKLTVDNLESQIAVAQIGPFLLTKLIAPKILAARTASYTPRVVIVSSVGHTFGSGINFDTFAHPECTEKYRGIMGYAQAKSANILFALELSRRSAGKINAYSLHPGAVVTNMAENEINRGDLVEIGVLKPDGKPTDKFKWKTIPEDQPGSYLIDCAVANNQIAPHSSDVENAARLWTATEEIIGERFTFPGRPVRMPAHCMLDPWTACVVC